MAKVKFTDGGLSKTTINQYFLCQASFYLWLKDSPKVTSTASKKQMQFYYTQDSGAITEVKLTGKFTGKYNDPIKKLETRQAAMAGQPWSGWTKYEKVKGLKVGDFANKEFNSLRDVVLKGNDFITGSKKSEETLHGYQGNDELHLYSGDEGYGGEGSDIFVLDKITRKAKIRDFNFGQDEIHIKGDNYKNYELSSSFGDYVVRHIPTNNVIAYVEGSSAGSTRGFKFNQAPEDDSLDFKTSYPTLLHQNIEKSL